MHRFNAIALALGFTFIFLGALPPIASGVPKPKAAITKANLGRLLFNDTSLSSPGGQACASCHAGGSHFTDPRGTITSEGAVKGRFGSRQSPSAAYMAFSPTFSFSDEEQDYIGGQFWDGRAGTLEDQARKPFLNPSEMNNSNPADVVSKVMASPEADGMRAIFGNDVFSNVDRAYSAIVNAIAAFEATPPFQSFSSKYDAYLGGSVKLTPAEARGLEIFNRSDKGNCAACHPSAPGPHGEPPLFTDFSYDNIGVPKNKNNPFYTQAPEFNPAGAAFVDEGLYNTTGRPQDRGRFKVPTLRNIGATGPYFHNGFATTLDAVVLLYNTRDLPGFPPAEEPRNVNHEETGNLGLTPSESADLVSFLKTLTDGYTPALRP